MVTTVPSQTANLPNLDSKSTAAAIRAVGTRRGRSFALVSLSYPKTLATSLFKINFLLATLVDLGDGVERVRRDTAGPRTLGNDAGVSESDIHEKCDFLALTREGVSA
jgi:hypothetical protein